MAKPMKTLELHYPMIQFTATNLVITTPRTSCIYFLPKIHKPNNPGRPIVSACSCPTELISSYLEKIMTPIVRSLPSHVKDSQHALQIFQDFNFLGEDKLIFTMDITSLYTIIPNCEGLLALNPGGVLPYMGYIGMCRGIGYGFWRFSILK